jgi:nitrogen fixation/metabolism regulation signal transduction histidine kinase
MSESPESLVPRISVHLREWIHEVNNALFVTKGFLEEIQADVQDRNYESGDFDHDNFNDMLKTIVRNVERIDQNLQKLRKYAKQDLFEISGVPPSR